MPIYIIGNLLWLYSKLRFALREERRLQIHNQDGQRTQVNPQVGVRGCCLCSSPLQVTSLRRQQQAEATFTATSSISRRDLHGHRQGPSQSECQMAKEAFFSLLSPHHGTIFRFLEIVEQPFSTTQGDWR